MKAIAINPFDQTVEEIEVSGGLQSIYEQIDSDVFDLVRIDEKNWIYVDDMGWWREPAKLYGFHWNGYVNPLIGKAIIMGDAQSTSLDLETVKSKVHFLGLLTRDKMPPVTFTSWE